MASIPALAGEGERGRASPRTAVPALLAAALLTLFALATLRVEVIGIVPGTEPDSPDYAYGAESLLRGQYVVSWDGAPRMPRPMPGFSILLIPAVAVGGVQAAVWVSLVAGLALGVLAALLAARLGGPLAAPLAVATVLFAAAPVAFARMVMSDLPTATLVMLELALLALWRCPASAVAAGVVAGALVWIRPPAVVLLSAGLSGLSAYGQWRRSAAWYLTGATAPLAGLAVWQFMTFGSPFTTTYQALRLTPGQQEGLGSFFSLQYVLGPPYRADGPQFGGAAEAWGLPSILLYPLQLAGADAFLSLPGIGLIGLVGLIMFARQDGVAGVVGRFGLVSVVSTLAIFVPYFWQSGRFLMAPAAVLGVAAAALLAQGVSVVARGAHQWGNRIVSTPTRAG